MGEKETGSLSSWKMGWKLTGIRKTQIWEKLSAAEFWILALNDHLTYKQRCQRGSLKYSRERSGWRYKFGRRQCIDDIFSHELGWDHQGNGSC